MYMANAAVDYKEIKMLNGAGEEVSARSGDRIELGPCDDSNKERLEDIRIHTGEGPHVLDRMVQCPTGGIGIYLRGFKGMYHADDFRVVK